MPLVLQLKLLLLQALLLLPSLLRLLARCHRHGSGTLAGIVLAQGDTAQPAQCKAGDHSLDLRAPG